MSKVPNCPVCGCDATEFDVSEKWVRCPSCKRSYACAACDEPVEMPTVEIDIETLAILISATEVRRDQYETVAHGYWPDFEELVECKMDEAQGMTAMFNAALDKATKILNARSSIR